MPDLNPSVPGASLKLSEKTIQSLRDSWRAAGGVAYSAPSGQMAAIAEPKLFAFLSEFLLAGDRTAPHRAGPTQDRARDLDEVRDILSQLVKAVCPGMDRNDLLADAAFAIAAMASAEPAAYFGIDDEPLDNGQPRFLQIALAHKDDPDVFPLYRRARTVAELAAHVAQQRAATDDAKAMAPVATQSDTKAAAGAKKASAK